MARRPSTIVRKKPSELDKLFEDIRIQAIANFAHSNDQAVGCYALAWHDIHARGRSDADLAKMVRKRHPGSGDVSADYLRTCCAVAANRYKRIAG